MSLAIWLMARYTKYREGRLGKESWGRENEERERVRGGGSGGRDRKREREK